MAFYIMLGLRQPKIPLYYSLKTMT